MSDPNSPVNAGDPPAPLIVVLVPTTDTVDPSLDYYCDYSQSHQEFARAFETLGLAWRWQPVTSGNYRAVLNALVAEQFPAPPLVFNLCDGDESNNVPGIGVIHHLDALGLAYTGSDAVFYRDTTSKIGMKRAFDAAGVPTPPWEVVGPDLKEAEAIVARLASGTEADSEGLCQAWWYRYLRPY
jgi:D-alanine-D-alanine ligase